METSKKDSRFWCGKVMIDGPFRTEARTQPAFGSVSNYCRNRPTSQELVAQVTEAA